MLSRFSICPQAPPEWILRAGLGLLNQMGSCPSERAAWMIVSEADSKAVVMGRYEHVSSALRVDRCRSQGVPVLKRITGGIPLELKPGVVHVAWVLPHPSAWVGATPRNIINRYVRGLLKAFNNWGMDSLYGGKEWIQTGDSHIGYVTYEVTADGGVLMEAFLAREAPWLLRPDLLAYPVEESFGSGGRPTATLESLAGRKVDLNELAERLRAGYAEHYRITWEISPLPTVHDLESLGCSALPETTNFEGYGHAMVRDSIGFVEAFSRVEDGRIREARIYGDFLSDSQGYELLADRLHDIPPERETLNRVVESVYASDPHFLIGVKPASIVEAILSSLKGGDV